MSTRMSGTSGRWSMWMAVAILTAMTSTLSAQPVESKGGPAAASPSMGSAGSVSVGELGALLSGQGAAQVLPTYDDFCGTDTTLQREALLARMQAQLVSVLFHSGMHLFSGPMALHVAVLRSWLQSTVGVAKL